MTNRIAVLLLLLVATGCAAPEPIESWALTSSKIDSPAEADADKDGIPDKDDCDPKSSALGLRLLEDSLANAAGAIKAAPTFPSSAWLHTAGAFEQRYVHDEGDASRFAISANGEDVSIEVTAAVEDTDPLLDSLRQTMVIIDAPSNGEDDFVAYGCGIEVVDGAPKTSIVKLAGSADYVRTTSLKRERRAFLEIGEEVDISARVSDGTLTCTVTQDKTSTTIIASVGAISGTGGFFTRQVAASFKDARVCRVSSGSSTGKETTGTAEPTETAVKTK